MLFGVWFVRKIHSPWPQHAIGKWQTQPNRSRRIQAFEKSKLSQRIIYNFFFQSGSFIISFLYSHNHRFLYGRIVFSFPITFSFLYCLVFSPVTVILPTLTLTFLLKDVDKTQTEIMRHHTSISELKRSFMESVPESRPSEWDKRLSINLPFCTASINGQLQAVVSPAERGQKIHSNSTFMLQLFLNRHTFLHSVGSSVKTSVSVWNFKLL